MQSQDFKTKREDSLKRRRKRHWYRAIEEGPGLVFGPESYLRLRELLKEESEKLVDPLEILGIRPTNDAG